MMSSSSKIGLSQPCLKAYFSVASVCLTSGRKSVLVCRLNIWSELTDYSKLLGEKKKNPFAMKSSFYIFYTEHSNIFAKMVT